MRLIDTVGYMVDGAMGAEEEDGAPRMVTTPWFEEPIPMTQAAELGTKKVMEEHSSIGIVLTTDGTVTDIPRQDYVQAEQRAITDMKATGKPFLVLVNSEQPDGQAAQALREQLAEQYGVHAVCVNCLTMTVQEILGILTQLLYEFPVSELRFFLPGWVTALPAEHPLKTTLYEAMRQSAANISRLSEAEPAVRKLLELEQVEDFAVRDVDLGSGILSCVLTFPEKLFYQVLSEESGFPVENDGELLELLESLSAAKREYDRIAPALEQVRATGYGIVMPSAEEMHLEVPQIVRKTGITPSSFRPVRRPSIHDARGHPHGDQPNGRRRKAVGGLDPLSAWRVRGKYRKALGEQYFREIALSACE